MSYELSNRISIKILFNQEEFRFERVNSFEFIHMVASTKLAVPILHMAVQDNIDSLSESKHFSDSALIQLVISDGASKFSTTYAFRLNTYKRLPNNGGYRYELDAYLDAVTYWHASTTLAKVGSSYKVIQGIAEDCGLKFVGDQTLDSQTWVPRNIPYHEWARRISERGYRSDTSFMQLGLNLDKTLVYRDLTNDKPPVAKFVSSETKEGFITATDVQPKINSGTMNHFSGYAEAHIEQDMESTTLWKVHQDIQVNKKASDGVMMVSSKIKDAVKQARVTFGPIDCGNVHKEYERAFYQNRRQNNLFTVGLDVVTKTASKVMLLDKVSLSLDNASTYLKTYSGDYRVCAKVVHIQGNEYYEKFELLRRTMNSNLTDTVG